MQQLKVEQNNSKKERRSGKGRVIALSRRIYRLMQTEDVFYVESESTDNVYYFVKFKPDVIEYCTCPDNSLRRGDGQMKCKHLHAIEFAIRLGTLKDVDRLPTDAKVSKVVATLKPTKSSFTADDYSF